MKQIRPKINNVEYEEGFSDCQSIQRQDLSRSSSQYSFLDKKNNYPQPKVSFNRKKKSSQAYEKYQEQNKVNFRRDNYKQMEENALNQFRTIEQDLRNSDSRNMIYKIKQQIYMKEIQECRISYQNFQSIDKFDNQIQIRSNSKNKKKIKDVRKLQSKLIKQIIRLKNNQNKSRIIINNQTNDKIKGKLQYKSLQFGKRIEKKKNLDCIKPLLKNIYNNNKINRSRKLVTQQSMSYNPSHQQNNQIPQRNKSQPSINEELGKSHLLIDSKIQEINRKNSFHRKSDKTLLEKEKLISMINERNFQINFKFKSQKKDKLSRLKNRDSSLVLSDNPFKQKYAHTQHKLGENYNFLKKLKSRKASFLQLLERKSSEKKIYRTNSRHKQLLQIHEAHNNKQKKIRYDSSQNIPIKNQLAKSNQICQNNNSHQNIQIMLKTRLLSKILKKQAVQSIVKLKQQNKILQIA